MFLAIDCKLRAINFFATLFYDIMRLYESITKIGAAASYTSRL